MMYKMDYSPRAEDVLLLSDREYREGLRGQQFDQELSELAERAKAIRSGHVLVCRASGGSGSGVTVSTCAYE